MREVCFSTAAVAALLLVSGGAQAAASLKAHYLFQNNFASSVAGAPDLVALNPTGAGGFDLDTVAGIPARTVYHVGGSVDPALQGGLQFDTTGLLAADSYSVALTFKLFDRQDDWRRILDVSDRQSDSGLYVDPGNNLAIYPDSGSNVAFTNGVYRNIVLTVGPAGPDNVHAYIDGGQSLATTTAVMNLGASGIINVFLDNVMGSGQLEWSRANIAALSFYDGVLTADEVSAINGDPLNPPTVPEPSMWAMMIAGFGMVGLSLRRARLRVIG
jgi:hypothetical protein